MFLLPDQQLRRVDRVMRQRLVPYVHETLSHCQLRAFANEGEPEQSADFLARVRENKVDFLDFMVPGAWGARYGVPHGSRFVDVSTVSRSKAEPSNWL